MTPLQLSILLHYYGHADDYREGDFSAPAVRKAIDWFREDAGMLEISRRSQRTYDLTEKGTFFVEYICSLPLPVGKWVMP